MKVRQRSTPKAPTMHDVCIMLHQGPDREPRHVSTPYYNLPYKIAHKLGESIVGASNQPRGTFYMLPKNGEKPIKQLSLPLTTTNVLRGS